MAQFDPIQTSLNGGELSPLLSGAVDLDKYRAGLAAQKNYLSLVQGPATLRPGSRYISACKDSTKKARLLDFRFSQTQALVLEFGNYYIRFYQNQAPVLLAGAPYELAAPYSADEVGQLYGFESADIIYLLHPKHIPMMLMRYGATDWQLQPMPFDDGPYLDENATASTLTPSAATGAITLTAAPAGLEMTINGDFTVKGLTAYGGGCMSDWAWTHGSNWLLLNGKAVKTAGDANVLSQALRNLISGESYVVVVTVSGLTAGSVRPKVGGTPGTAISSNGTSTQTITAGSGSLLEFLPSSDFNGGLSAISVKIVPSKTGLPFFDPGHVGSLWRLYYYLQPAVLVINHAYNVGDLAYVSYQPAGYATVFCVVKCAVAGTSGSTAINIAVLKQGDAYADGSVTWLLQNDPSQGGYTAYGWGAVRATGYVDAWTMNAQVIGTLGAAQSTTNWREGAWSDFRGWPGAGTFHDGRLLLAGTLNQPQTIWGGKVADFYNFAPQDNITDDGPLTFTLDSDEVNRINWLKSTRRLMAGTGTGVWAISGKSGDQITPTSISARQDIGEGSSSVNPIRTGSVLLYLENHGDPANPGRKLKELAYDYVQDNYVAPDLSILSEHLTATGLIALAFQRQPYKILWAVRNDGLLLSMVYERPEKVVGWNEHPMAGLVESCAVIPGAYQDELWLIVNRTLNGETVRCVEMLERLNWQEVSTPSNVADCFFVDCGSTVISSPASTAISAPHLANATVAILADGKPHRQLTLDGGGNGTLDYAAAKVQVGLPIANYLQTLRPEGGSKQGTAQGKKKSIAKVNIRLVESWGGKLGPDSNSLENICDRDSSFRSEAPVLVTGDRLVGYKGAYETDAQVYITQDLPLPFTVAAIMPRIDVMEN
jgi:hypothetical protein